MTGDVLQTHRSMSIEKISQTVKSVCGEDIAQRGREAEIDGSVVSLLQVADLERLEPGMGRRLKLPSRHQRSGSWSTAPLRVGPATCARTTPVEEVLVSQTEKASRKRSRGTEPLVARRRTARSTLTTRTRAVLPAQRTAPLQGFRQGRSSLWPSAVARPIWPPSWRLRVRCSRSASLPKTATATRRVCGCVEAAKHGTTTCLPANNENSSLGAGAQEGSGDV